MKLINNSSIINFFLILPTFLPSLISSQTCHNSCGIQPIKYPFSTSLGCGNPHFQTYITCNQDQLTFTTQTGHYPITSIDYTNQLIYITYPSMSTCFCTQPSKGFSLDWNVPFSFYDNTVFALLDYSTSSPIYKSVATGGTINSSFPLCDSKRASICYHLYSCQAISKLDILISTCCVYTLDLGPSFEVDLEKLQCSPYSGLCGFVGQENNPENWKYGLALKYKFNFNNDYLIKCDKCEKSNGVCRYTGLDNSFLCNCPTGFHTTIDCYCGQSWSTAFGLLPWQSATLLASFMGMILA